MEPTNSQQTTWSFQIGRVLGIPIRVHFTFGLLVIWYAVVSSQWGDNTALAVLFLLLAFTCVLLHELGHAAMARQFQVQTRDIVLYPIGGIARLENMPEGKAELFIALAGPVVNLVLAFGLFVLILAAGLPLSSTGEPLQSVPDLAGRLFMVNLVLFFFNLLPAFPMDGGRVLRAGLSLMLTPERATAIAATIGQGFAILFAIVGILSQQYLFVLVALFVFIGAAQEAFIYRQRAVVQGKTARMAMITRFESLAPQDSLERAAEHLLATHQQDFPVLDAWKRVVGILPRGQLMTGLAQLGNAAAVLDVMERNFSTVTPEEELDQVLQRLRSNPGMPLIVIDGDQLVGMITLENLTEFIEISRRQFPEPKS